MGTRMPCSEKLFRPNALGILNSVLFFSIAVPLVKWTLRSSKNDLEFSVHNFYPMLCTRSPCRSTNKISNTIQFTHTMLLPIKREIENRLSVQLVQIISFISALMSTSLKFTRCTEWGSVDRPFGVRGPSHIPLDSVVSAWIWKFRRQHIGKEKKSWGHTLWSAQPRARHRPNFRDGGRHLFYQA